MLPSTPDFSSPAPGQLLTPPPSPRKRRRVLRDSEETGGNISLEKYILASDPYRSTSLPSPPPYPLSITGSPELADFIRPFLREIFQILRNHGFPSPTTVEADTFCKPGYPGWDLEMSLLRVVVKGSQHFQIYFGPAKDQIMKLLEEKGVMDIQVEIVNTDLYHVPSFFYLASKDPLVVAFEHAVDGIITILNQMIPQRWHMVCPFDIGTIQGKAQPAIAVLVKPLTETNWSVIRNSIISLINAVLPDATFDVEFVPGEICLFNSGPKSGGHSFINRITSAFKMGDSVGISDQNNAGTLGGWVKLEHNGIVHRGFLTNYHVIRPSVSEKYTQPFLNHLDRYGATFDRPLSQPIYVHSLPGMDRDETFKDIERVICGSRTQMASLLEKAEQQKMAGEVKPGLRQMLEDSQLMITDLLRQKDLVEKMPVILGKVLVTSGASVLGNALMDWAFVEVSSEIENRFFHPNEMFEIPAKIRPGLYKEMQSTITLRTGLQIDTFGSLGSGEYCVKIGRTTEVTSGICHGAKAVCNWEDVSVRFTHEGEEVSMVNNPTREYLIINKRPNAADYEEACFANDGDSGSFILNENGDLTGILFGSTKRQWAFAGIAMSMADVLVSMKLKLGASVSLSLPQ